MAAFPKMSLAAPVFAAPGIPTLRTPSMREACWDDVRALVQEAERLGYESAWFSDHLFHGRDGQFHESWTALSMAAGFTERITLVNNHLGNGFRDARVMAKMATTLADATGDRFELFLATGYRQREFDSYGLRWPDENERLDRLAEAIEVFRLLWSGEQVDFDGEFYPLDGAVAAPTGGAQPFLWLGGPLTERSLELIAREADGWNSFPLGLEAYAEAGAAVDAACRAIGRDPSTLRRSLETQVLVLDGADDWEGWLRLWRTMRQELPLGPTFDDFDPDAFSDDTAVTEACRRDFIIGTRSEVAARIADYAGLGVTDLVCWFMDAPSSASMAALADLAIGPTAAERH